MRILFENLLFAKQFGNFAIVAILDLRFKAFLQNNYVPAGASLQGGCGGVPPPPLFTMDSANVGLSTSDSASVGLKKVQVIQMLMISDFNLE